MSASEGAILRACSSIASLQSLADGRDDSLGATLTLAADALSGLLAATPAPIDWEAFDVVGGAECDECCEWIGEGDVAFGGDDCELQCATCRLAESFRARVQSWLTDAQLRLIDIANRDEPGDGCASHDWCDPNQAMIDAYESLFGELPEGFGASGAITDHMNEAWNAAKARGFRQQHP